MNRIGRVLFLPLLWCACVDAGLPHTAGAAQGPARGAVQPNVILILADDFAIGDLGTFSDGVSRTPHLDRLAEDSVRFQQAYSASCVCAPARAAILTGRYPHRTGVVTLNMNRYPDLTRLRNDEVTIADVLRANGYTTGLIGKWHCGVGAGHHPIDRGFDEFEGFSGSQELSYFRYLLDVNRQQTRVDGKYLTDDLSQRAIEFIRRHRDRPFFLHLAHYAPHRPLEAPADIVEAYLERGLDRSTATIYAMNQVMDRGIGELLAELNRLELAQQTVVIFASDNGPDPLTGTRPNQDLRGTKYQVYEGGIRVPLFVRAPGIAPGDCPRVVHFVDIFPTIIDLCNARYEVKQPLDGRSFRPLLDKNSEFLDAPRFWQWNRGIPNYTHNAAMRDGPWKLVRPYVTRNANPENSGHRAVLYNLAETPDETIDQAEHHPKRVSEMLMALEEWSRDVETNRTRDH